MSNTTFKLKVKTYKNQYKKAQGHLFLIFLILLLLDICYIFLDYLVDY